MAKKSLLFSFVREIEYHFYRIPPKLMLRENCPPAISSRPIVPIFRLLVSLRSPAFHILPEVLPRCIKDGAQAPALVLTRDRFIDWHLVVSRPEIRPGKLARFIREKTIAVIARSFRYPKKLFDRSMAQIIE